MKRSAVFLVFFFIAFAAAGEGKTYKVAIVSDNLRDKFLELHAGFKETLNKLLAAEGSKAEYTVYDTQGSPSTVDGILQALVSTKPDLICAVNNPAVFTDTNIIAKLKDPAFKIVSEDCIPVQAGIIKDWAKPGGNITGIGVFLPVNGIIRLARKIDPRIKKLIYYSFEPMKLLNQWLELEVRKACREEGMELAEFRLIKNMEEEIAIWQEFDLKGPEYLVTGGISAYVKKDGSPVDMNEVAPKYLRQFKNLFTATFDEMGVRNGALAGTCVIWYDMGAQLAEQGNKILDGANPGDLPWEYPRKFNILLNNATAKQKGVEFTQELITAAYRIYTDFEGAFIGKAN